VDADLDQDWAWPQSQVESLGVATNSWTNYEIITHVFGRVVGENRTWAAAYHFFLQWLEADQGRDCAATQKSKNTFREGQQLLPASLAANYTKFTTRGNTSSRNPSYANYTKFQGGQHLLPEDHVCTLGARAQTHTYTHTLHAAHIYKCICVYRYICIGSNGKQINSAFLSILLNYVPHKTTRWCHEPLQPIWPSCA
jgi:hypothetical protein